MAPLPSAPSKKGDIVTSPETATGIPISMIEEGHLPVRYDFTSPESPEEREHQAERLKHLEVKNWMLPKENTPGTFSYLTPQYRKQQARGGLDTYYVKLDKIIAEAPDTTEAEMAKLVKAELEEKFKERIHALEKARKTAEKEEKKGDVRQQILEGQMGASSFVGKEIRAREVKKEIEETLGIMVPAEGSTPDEIEEFAKAKERFDKWIGEVKVEDEADFSAVDKAAQRATSQAVSKGAPDTVLGQKLAGITSDIKTVEKTKTPKQEPAEANQTATPETKKRELENVIKNIESDIASIPQEAKKLYGPLVRAIEDAKAGGLINARGALEKLNRAIIEWRPRLIALPVLLDLKKKLEDRSKSFQDDSRVSSEAKDSVRPTYADINQKIENLIAELKTKNPDTQAVQEISTAIDAYTKFLDGLKTGAPSVPKTPSTPTASPTAQNSSTQTVQQQNPGTRGEREFGEAEGERIHNILRHNLTGEGYLVRTARIPEPKRKDLPRPHFFKAGEKVLLQDKETFDIAMWQVKSTENDIATLINLDDDKAPERTIALRELEKIWQTNRYYKNELEKQGGPISLEESFEILKKKAALSTITSEQIANLSKEEQELIRAAIEKWLRYGDKIAYGDGAYNLSESLRVFSLDNEEKKKKSFERLQKRMQEGEIPLERKQEEYFARQFRQRISKLLNEGVLYGFPSDGYPLLNYAGRIIVLSKVGNRYLPFYCSTKGTSGKQAGKWYPFLGLDPGGNWIIKHNVDTLERGFGIPQVKEIQDRLNRELGNIPVYKLDSELVGARLCFKDSDDDFFLSHQLFPEISLRPNNEGRRVIEDGREYANEAIAILAKELGVEPESPKAKPSAGKEISGYKLAEDGHLEQTTGLPDPTFRDLPQTPLLKAGDTVMLQDKDSFEINKWEIARIEKGVAYIFNTEDPDKNLREIGIGELARIKRTNLYYKNKFAEDNGANNLSTPASQQQATDAAPERRKRKEFASGDIVRLNMPDGIGEYRIQSMDENTVKVTPSGKFEQINLEFTEAKFKELIEKGDIKGISNPSLVPHTTFYFLKEGVYSNPKYDHIWAGRFEIQSNDGGKVTVKLLDRPYQSHELTRQEFENLIDRRFIPPVKELLSKFNKKTNFSVGGLLAWKAQWIDSGEIDRYREEFGNVQPSPEQIENAKETIEAYAEALQQGNPTPELKMDSLRKIAQATRILTGKQDQFLNDIEYDIKNGELINYNSALSVLDAVAEPPNEAPTESKATPEKLAELNEMMKKVHNIAIRENRAPNQAQHLDGPMEAAAEPVRENERPAGPEEIIYEDGAEPAQPQAADAIFEGATPAEAPLHVQEAQINRERGLARVARLQGLQNGWQKSKRFLPWVLGAGAIAFTVWFANYNYDKNIVKPTTASAPADPNKNTAQAGASNEAPQEQPDAEWVTQDDKPTWTKAVMELHGDTNNTIISPDLMMTYYNDFHTDIKTLSPLEMIQKYAPTLYADWNNPGDSLKWDIQAILSDKTAQGYEDRLKISDGSPRGNQRRAELSYLVKALTATSTATAIGPGDGPLTSTTLEDVILEVRHKTLRRESTS